jgi:hypothetical protein
LVKRQGCGIRLRQLQFEFLSLLEYFIQRAAS